MPSIRPYAPVKWVKKRLPRLVEEVGPLKNSLQSTAAQKLYEKEHPGTKKVAMLMGFFDEIEKISQAPAAPPPAPSPGMGAPTPAASATPGADPLGSGSASLPPPKDPASSIGVGKAASNV